MHDISERLAASLADRYRIERKLGAGGMATVYLAADLKHDRKVAIKVLKPELAAVLGAERFVQEIKTTAALSHPHILPLFDSGEAGGFLYYVMPYIEGETIREKLNRETQFGIDEAVRITAEVADALDYAHRHGVIHRDIKPENILLHDGRPMVMDFGIALAVSAAAGGRMTETGLSLGTPHYMSPEQATADKDITARSDIYSLASVCYEMLAGNPPHTGSSAQQIIMKIITEAVPPVTSVRKSAPAHVAAALATALQKLPADRFASARDFAQALANPLYASALTGAVTGGVAPAARVQRTTLVLSGALVVVSAVAVWLGVRPPADPTWSARYAVALPTASALRTPAGASMTVSADGGVLVFAGADSAGTQRLWAKRSSEIDAAPIQGTEDAFSPFLSPDGTQLGFFRGVPATMFVVALSGGTAREIAGLPVGSSGGYWATNGYIYFDANEGGIDRVRPDGTARETVIALDTVRREAGYAWPEVLPGNEVLVARLRREGASLADFDIVAVPLNGKEKVTLTRGVAARHLRGQLLVLRADGVLIAYRLRDGGMAIDSVGTVLATDVRVWRDAFGAADVVTDGRGTLHYVSAAGGASGTSVRVAWLMPGGGLLEADSAQPIDGFQVGMLPAPNRRRAILGGASDTSRFWVRDLPSGIMLPISFDVRRFRGAGWLPSSDSMLVAASTGTGSELLLFRADGLGSPVSLARDTGLVGGIISTTPDGRVVTAHRFARGTGAPAVVWLDRQRDTVWRTLIPPARRAREVTLSPDGRWLAYATDLSGRDEVYVQSFPNVDAGLVQVSVDGGATPQWSPRGDRLFFVRRQGRRGVFVVDVTTSPVFRASAPRELYGRAQLEGVELDGGWAVGPDGERLLVLARVASHGRPQLVRVENPLAALLNARPGAYRP